MRTITISAGDRRELNLEEYKNRSAVESDYDELIDEPFMMYQGDSLLIAYLQLEEDLSPIKTALRKIRYEKSTRTSGLKTTSRVFGYLPRVAVRRDYCTATSLSHEQPTEHEVIVTAGNIVAKHYRELNPSLYDQHLAITQEKVESDYRVQGSVFTSGIINENNPLKYHFDKGNFSKVWSGMLVFKDDIEGGYLALPEFNIGVALRDCSLFMFDGQGILHGVTPIKKLSPNARRYSIVYYSMQGMWNCEPLNDELLRIRQVRTGRERKPR